MFESSLKLGSAPENRRAGPLTLAATAHLLVLIPAGAFSLLMVEDVVLPRDPMTIPNVLICLSERSAAPALPAGTGGTTSAGPRGPAEGRAAPSPPQPAPAPPDSRLESARLDLDSLPDPAGAAGWDNADATGDGTSSIPGLPRGGDGGPGIPGVDRGDGGGGGEPIPLTSGVEAPQLILKVLPDYPSVARAARVSGKVYVKAVISPLGDVVDVEVVRSSSPLLNESALTAVRGWKYRPARRNGEAVAVYFTVVVDFILQ